jgi:hypothetical protein
MGDVLYSHVKLSYVPDVKLRFTNDVPSRTTQLSADRRKPFEKLPHSMTRRAAAKWMRSRPEYSSAEWQSAIAYELRDRKRPSRKAT